MNILNRRRQMGDKGLPYDCEVEYLESTGTQYIDTRIIMHGDTSEFRMTYSGKTDEYFSCGVRQSYNDRAFVFSNGGSNWKTYNKYFLNYGTLSQMPTYLNDEVIHTVVMNNTVIVDSQLLYTFTTSSFTTSDTFYLFAGNTKDYGIRYGYMRIYKCQFYENGVLVRDFIPVRKGTTGYMYDKVSGQLFGNSGTGDFISGNDIVEIEYLESTGTQYIDTGINPDATTTITLDAQYTQQSNIYNCDNGLMIGGNARFHIGVYTNKFYYGCRSNYLTTISYDTDRHLFELSGDGTAKVDETSYTVSAQPLTTINNPIYLYARNNGNNVNQYINGFKIFRCLIKKDDVIVRDLIPVRIGTTGYILDKITNQLFGNSGTGDFILGPDKI